MTAPPRLDAAPDDEHLPGLAGERTDLAWSRSSLTLNVLAAAILLRVWDQVDTLTVQLVVFGILAAAGVAGLGALWWSHTVGRTTIEGRRVADVRVLRRVTVATVILSAAALVLAAVPYE